MNSKQLKRAWRQPLETGGFLLLKWIIPFLPRCAVTGLSLLAGRLAMLLPLREKRVGLKNLDAVYGETKTPAEKRRILRISFATFCQTMLDLFWFSRNPEKRIPRYVEVESSPAMDLLLGPDPLICISAHMGSWETIGLMLAMKGVDLASIAATMNNRSVDRTLIKLREGTGQTIIPQKGAMRTVIARFREGGKVAFVLDQRTSVSKGGISVNFLGIPTPVSSAPAALACRTGTSIAFLFCLPRPKGRYLVQAPHSIIPPALEPDQDMDNAVLKLTQNIQDFVSNQILEHPQFWLWSYKLWRRSPEQIDTDYFIDY